jgi:hypothetical protein
MVLDLDALYREHAPALTASLVRSFGARRLDLIEARRAGGFHFRARELGDGRRRRSVEDDVRLLSSRASARKRARARAPHAVWLLGAGARSRASNEPRPSRQWFASR